MSKIGAHEVIQALKDLALELGRRPTVRDLPKSKTSKRQVYQHFKSLDMALRAAGLGPSPKKRKIRDEDLFTVDIHSQLIDHFKNKPKPEVSSSDFPIAIMGDLHAPFTNFDGLSAFYTHLEMLKPKLIIQVGDAYDMFSHGKFPRSVNIYTPEKEMEAGYSIVKGFWETVRKICPDARCVMLSGNHDVRPLKRIIENYPEGEIFFSIDPFFKFEGVEWIKDHRQEFIVNDIQFIHGYFTAHGKHLDHSLMNVVHGHTHRGGVTYRQINGKVLFELDVGYMGDPESKALSYTPQKIVKWTHGYGVIDEYGPRFIPL